MAAAKLEAVVCHEPELNPFGDNGGKSVVYQLLDQIHNNVDKSSERRGLSER